ncbi:thiamine-phosphate kinase [Chitinibacteraceae bacterium HSL-7]
MGEFELIARHFARPVRAARLGVGDDCALIAPPAGCELAVSVDMLVSGRHFFADVDPEALGHKALAVNLSDLAAMGAQPAWCTLALALPAADDAWLAAFARGFFALADAHGVELVGGDTTRGPLTISIQIAGYVPAGGGLLRSSAQAGDDIWVSGVLGAAAAGVAQRSEGLALSGAQQVRCRQRLERPEPRIALGLALRDVAHSALDLSDGIAGDMGHIAGRSGLAARIDVDALPLDPVIADLPQALDFALAGGDEYELCFTASPAQRERILAIAAGLALPLTRVGQMEAGSGVRLERQGAPYCSPRHAFDHFA